MAIGKSGQLQGAKGVQKALNHALNAIVGDVFIGLELAVKHVQAESQEIAPIDFGPLRASAFSDVQMVGQRIVGRVGYTAEYAPWVHEMPMTLKGQPRADFGVTREGVSFGGGSSKGTYWDGGTENKFLEKAFVRNANVIFDIVRKKVHRSFRKRSKR